MAKSGRVMLITGAAGGVGRGTVRVFAEYGWKIIGIDRNDFGAGFPENGKFINAEISNPGGLGTLFEKVRNISSHLDAVVNNAAVQIAKPILETTLEEWDEVISTNLRSAFIIAKLAHPLLKAAKISAIVNVSSVHAIATSANISAYAASKGGLLALTRAMAIEFAKDNIRVNAILPGAVDTPMLRAGLERGHLNGGTVSDRLENLARKTVNGRVGTPEEIAHAVYFLADSTKSSFMTGQALIIDGGATARLSTE
jgi:glucose 1-dehydrogenase